MQPSRARYWVVVFAVTLAILCYIDRVCMSQVAPALSRDLGLDKVQMGFAFAAFGLAYACFEIPGGWMGDWMGTRKVLLRIVLWWSAFTALTGTVIGFRSLLVTRFLFGAGEAGCFPNLTKSFSAWLPVDERVRAQGIMWTAARWGGAFTPPLVALVVSFVTWRQSFMIFGALGVVWSVFFYRWYRDDPRTHPSVNAGELELLKDTAGLASGHANVPWLKLVSSSSIWLLWLQYFCVSYPWYFYITWLPTYLQERLKLTPGQSASYAIVPLLFGGFGALAAGFITARLVRLTSSVPFTRRLLACSGFAGACVALLVASRMSDPLWAILAMGLSSFGNDLAMPGSWASCMDIGGKYAGTVSGSMNMMGNLGGAAAPAVGGVILAQTGGKWEYFLYSMAGSYLIAMVCWMIIDPVTPLEPVEPASPATVPARV
jgi:MFS transporter, ACS family, glucarate transporter